MRHGADGAACVAYVVVLVVPIVLQGCCIACLSRAAIVEPSHLSSNQKEVVMKIQIALLTVALLAGCSQQASNAEDGAATPAAATAASDAAPAQPADATDINMPPAEHQKMAEDAAAMGMTAETHEAMGMKAAKTRAAAGADASAKAEAKGMGVVKSIDAAGGKVTIAHEPIASLSWPAMTMAFNASPDLLAAVKEGDRVHFEFSQGEDGSTLSVLQPRK